MLSKLINAKKIFLLFVMIVLLVPALSADMDSSPIRVNQVGYFPDAKKVASIVDSRTSSIAWQLRNSSGTAVASGSTTVYGNDVASGDHIHKADFSAYIQTGSGYKLWVSGIGESVSFNIASNIYQGLEKDAMAYFYFHRMGEPVEASYLDNPAHARGALHTEASVTAFGGWTSSTFDVRKSWADAGDFGIYPVNHAVSAWALMNLYERYSSVLPDGSLSIPENNNGIPDILDEVVFGSTFMFNMLPDSGLATHKVHNETWGSPWSYNNFVNNENSQTRHAQPPSTNATYAVARNLAQIARVYQAYDASYASSLWARAEIAWNRAESNSITLYSAMTSDDVGGGDYGDSATDDDRYVAACELYLTAYARNDSTVGTYRNAVTGDSNFRDIDKYDWATVQTSGTLSLLSAANDLPVSDISAIENNIVSYVDSTLLPFLDPGNSLEEGYPNLINGSLGYNWGSNSGVINDLTIVAYAYDITNDLKYLKAIAQVMDYMMGTNPMRLSYITGWGEYAEEDPHDRWGIACLDYQNTAIPAGWLIGGPNNLTLNDPATPTDQPPAKSYAEPGTGAEAWCSKENTINWNAPLVWIAWYLNAHSTDLGSGTVATPTPTPTQAPTPTPTQGPTVPPGGVDLSLGSFGTYIDPYGSTVNPAAGTITPDENGVVSAGFNMVGEPTPDGDYPFGGVFFAFNDNNDPTVIELPIMFTYMSTGTVRFNIGQSDLNENGEAWGVNLPEADTWTTITIDENNLAQPSWASFTELNLADVLQLKWEPKMGAGGGAASIDMKGLQVGDSVLPTPTPAPTPTNPGSTSSFVWLIPETSTVFVDETFTTAIHVNSGSQNIAAYGFTVSFNSSIIAIDTSIGTSGVNAGADGFVSAVNTSNGGEIIINGFDVNGKGPGPSLEVVIVNWQAVGVGDTVLDLTVSTLTDSSYIDVGAAYGIDGSVSVIDVLLGDVNDDGVVNIVDALMVARVDVGLYSPGYNPAAADVNGDGSVNIVDALMIAQYYVGLITSF